jgi:hypothetical protein
MAKKKLSVADIATAEAFMLDRKLFATVATQPDDFRAIIISHTFLETLVERLWQRQMHVPSHSFYPGSYSAQVYLAEAVGEIKMSARLALLKLWGIRGRLAHQLGGDVEVSAIRELHKLVRSDGVMDLLYDSADAYVGELQSSFEGAQRQLRSCLITCYSYVLIRYEGAPAIHPAADTGRPKYQDLVAAVMSLTGNRT